MEKSIRAGISGFILAIIINLFLAPFLTLSLLLNLIPPFLAAMFSIYIYRLRAFKDGLLAAFMTYIFNEGFLGTLDLAVLYLMHEPYPSFNIEIWIVFYPIVSSITALIAGYVGVLLVQRTKPPQELPPSLPPPLPPV